MTQDTRFAELVGVACHDVRTPLATVWGFARTLSRLELESPAERYVEMIGAASSQITELIDQLSTVARIEGGRYDPALTEVDSLALAQEAAAELDRDRIHVSGNGGPVRVDLEPVRRALAQLARAAARHGGLEEVSLAVDGPELQLSPIERSAEGVLLGEDLKELSAAASAIVIRALGGSLEVADARLVIRLPSPAGSSPEG
jgi:signal transduction histidine kinase